MKKDSLNKQLEKINKDIDLNTKNLIYLLNNVNIEFINLIEYHYLFIDLTNKRKNIEDKIFNEKMKKL